MKVTIKVKSGCVIEVVGPRDLECIVMDYDSQDSEFDIYEPETTWNGKE